MVCGLSVWGTDDGMTAEQSDIVVRRVYDDDVRDGAALRGQVFLVDGMWPRGMGKDELALDGWLRDLAPSKQLRQWFGHRADRWEGFRERYRQELERNPHALQPLLAAVRRGSVTLLFATKETEHNNAIALRDYLTGTLGAGGGGDRPRERGGGRTKAQLYAQARARGIRGRSTMSKQELRRQLAR